MLLASAGMMSDGPYAFVLTVVKPFARMATVVFVFHFTALL